MRLLSLLLATLPLMVSAQSLDRHHIMVDMEASSSIPYTYRTFQEAVAHLQDSTVVYVKPGVYWIDDPDDPTVKVPQGRPRTLWNGCPTASISHC